MEGQISKVKVTLPPPRHPGWEKNLIVTHTGEYRLGYSVRLFSKGKRILRARSVRFLAPVHDTPLPRGPVLLSPLLVPAQSPWRGSSPPLVTNFPTAFRYFTVGIHFDFQLCNSTPGPGSIVWIRAHCEFIASIGGGLSV